MDSDDGEGHGRLGAEECWARGFDSGRLRQGLCLAMEDSNPVSLDVMASQQVAMTPMDESEQEIINPEPESLSRACATPPRARKAPAVFTPPGKVRPRESLEEARSSEIRRCLAPLADAASSPVTTVPGFASPAAASTDPYLTWQLLRNQAQRPWFLW